MSYSVEILQIGYTRLKDSSFLYDNGTVSKNPLLQEESRKKVLTLTDFIIPGHGDIFSCR